MIRFSVNHIIVFDLRCQWGNYRVECHEILHKLTNLSSEAYTTNTIFNNKLQRLIIIWFYVASVVDSGIFLFIRKPLLVSLSRVSLEPIYKHINFTKKPTVTTTTGKGHPQAYCANSGDVGKGFYEDP